MMFAVTTDVLRETRTKQWSVLLGVCCSELPTDAATLQLLVFMVSGALSGGALGHNSRCSSDSCRLEVWFVVHWISKTMGTHVRLVFTFMEG